MFYQLTRKELKDRNGTDFKQDDIIRINDTYEIEIDYGKNEDGTLKFKRASLCSKVFDLNKNKYQDVVFRPEYIGNFLHR